MAFLDVVRRRLGSCWLCAGRGLNVADGGQPLDMQAGEEQRAA